VPPETLFGLGSAVIDAVGDAIERSVGG
jgi:hypothetical protein